MESHPPHARTCVSDGGMHEAHAKST